MLADARGQTLDWMMWGGDPLINAYVQDYVAPILRDSFQIDLRVTPGQGNEIVTALMGELEAGRAQGAYDLVWINGETFYQLRRIDALWGPFASDLPSARYVDYENPFIGRDFQQPTDGYEAPWGNVQMTLIHDTQRTPNPPVTRADLYEWVRANPGRFTWDAQFTGVAFLKSLFTDIAGGSDALAGDFDEARYQPAIDEPDRLRRQPQTLPLERRRDLSGRRRPDASTVRVGRGRFYDELQRFRGRQQSCPGPFPRDGSRLRARQGPDSEQPLPGASRAWRATKPPHWSPLHLLQSPGAQLRKLDPAVWGDGTVLSLTKLPDSWRERFENAPGRQYAPTRASIADRAVPELAPEYTIRIERDFRERVIER